MISTEKLIFLMQGVQKINSGAILGYMMRISYFERVTPIQRAANRLICLLPGASNVAVCREYIAFSAIFALRTASIYKHG
jgi:hypothetical protein